MRRILFFPNYLGGGFGHTGRCLSLADAWREQGGEAFFAVDGPHAHRVGEAGYPWLPMGTPRMRGPGRAAPAYVYVPGMEYQIVRDGFDHPGVVRRAMREALGIVDAVKPDLLLGDGWPLTWLVGRRAGIPVVQVVKSVVRPDPERLAWWEPEPPGLIRPDPGPVFDPVLEENGLAPISRAEDLLKGDLYLIPGIPELDPVSCLPENAFHVGMIVRRPPGTAAPPAWLEKLDRARPILYVTVGGAAGNAGAPGFLRWIDSALGGMDCRVVVSSGGRDTSTAEGTLAPNLQLERWVPNWALLPLCEAVLFHGGYTRMEILDHGLPSIVIPFHSEQEFYGRQMEKNGCAVCLPCSDGPYLRKVERWRGGSWLRIRRFSVHFRPAPTLSPQALRRAVESVLGDREMRSAAIRLKESLRRYGGSRQAVSIIRSGF